MDFDLDAVLATPTQTRSEIEHEETSDFDLSGLEFEDHDQEEKETEIETDLATSGDQKDVVEIISDEEANLSGELLVDLLDTFHLMALTPLARWKLKKKIGGSKIIQKMQKLYEKELSEEELDKSEKEYLRQYKAYLRDKEEAEKLIPFTENERDKLQKSFASYCKKKGILFSGEKSFWMELGMIELMKITQIAML